MGQGLVLLLAGMGIVFTFLIVLSLVTEITMKFVGRFESIFPQDAPKKKPAPRAAGNDDEALAVAIAVALG